MMRIGRKGEGLLGGGAIRKNAHGPRSQDIFKF